MRLRTAWLLVFLAGIVPAQGSWMATVSGDKVRVRGGPADFHSILGQVKRGTPLRVVGEDGDWREVEVPGGFAVYVSMGKKDRPYLQEKAPGEGLILVNDLMIRGTPNTDFPPIGRLKVGDRVVILGKEKGWAKLASPAGADAWIHGKFVSRAADQGAVAKDWVSAHETHRRLLLESGANGKKLLARRAAEQKRRAATEAAFARFQTEKDKAWDQRDVAGLRGALVEVRDAYPESDLNRTRAVALLSTVDDWERSGSELRQARERLAQAKRDADAADRRFNRSMNDLRSELERKAQQPPKPTEAEKYPARGTVARVFPVEGLRRGPSFGIAIGNRTVYRLGGDRYDFADFEGKLIVVLESEEGEKIVGVDEPILDVRRIEILDG